MASPIFQDFLKSPASNQVDPELLNTAMILNDNQPILEVLNEDAIITWRKQVIRDIAVPVLNSNSSIYK